MPPVSWPTASIFCACAMATCACLTSLTSTDSTKQPSTSPSGPNSGTSSVRALTMRPSSRAISYS